MTCFLLHCNPGVSLYVAGGHAITEGHSYKVPHCVPTLRRPVGAWQFPCLSGLADEVFCIAPVCQLRSVLKTLYKFSLSIP